MEKSQDSTDEQSDGRSLLVAQRQGQLLPPVVNWPCLKCGTVDMLWGSRRPAVPVLQGEAAGGRWKPGTWELEKEGFRTTPYLLKLALAALELG